MRLAISGFSGVGKTQVIHELKKEKPEIFISTESAREVFETTNFFNLKYNDYKIFQKSILDNEFSKLNMILINNVKDSVFDRSLLDNIIFAENVFGKQNINYTKIQQLINKIRNKYEIEFLYDRNILIKIPEDKNFIINLLENDELRQKTTSKNIDEFIQKGKSWEKNYLDKLSYFDGLFESVDILEHFTRSDNTQNYIKKMFNIK